MAAIDILWPDRESSIDVALDDIFEDEEYGKKVLGLVRRKGTTDSIEYHMAGLDATIDEKERSASDEEEPLI